MLSTPSLPDGSAYRSSSLPSLHLQAKGSECSLTARRRVAERTSPLERCCVGAHNSSSGPCVLNPSIERNAKFFTSHFCAAAKVLHRWLRRREGGSSSPPVNNFGGTISTCALACGGRRPRRPLLPTHIQLLLECSGVNPFLNSGLDPSPHQNKKNEPNYGLTPISFFQKPLPARPDGKGVA
jgi:hypothetical protein